MRSPGPDGPSPPGGGSSVTQLSALFIGGNGIISSACSRLAVERGIDLTLLNRDGPPGRQESVVEVSSGWPRPRKKMPGKPDVWKPAFGLLVSRECSIRSVPVRSLLT